METFSRPLRILATLILLFSFLLSSSTIKAEPLTKSQMISDIYFKDINNKTHQLSKYRGKWLFINFWAGYCAICRQEIPTLIRFQQAHKDDVTILGVNYGGETHQEIKAAMARYKFNYTIIPGQSSIYSIFREVDATPTTIIISPEGRMVAKAIGQQSWQELSAFIKDHRKKEPTMPWDD